MSELVSAVGELDKPTLLRKLAALQCVPANSDCWFRINCLIALTLSLPGGTKPVTRSKLDAIVNRLCPEDWKRQEDPPEGPFVLPITGPLGTTLVISGPTVNPASQLQLMLQALLQGAADYPPAFTEATREVVTFLLSISGRICKIANLVRYEPTIHAPHGNVTIPPKDDFAALEQAVSIDGTFGQKAERALEKAKDFLREVGDQPDISASSGPSEAISLVSNRPVLRLAGGELLILQPSGLVSGQVDLILRMAEEYDCAEALLKNFHEASRGFVSRHLQFWGWEETSSASMVLIGSLGMWVSVDEWEFEPSVRLRVFTVSPARRTEGCFLKVELDALLGYANNPGDDTVKLNIVVFQPEGVEYSIAIAATEHAPPFLWMTPEELSAVFYTEDDDGLALIKFEHAMRVHRERTRVLAWGFLDEFSIYRSHRYGFYLSDEIRPSLLSIEAGTAAKLRAELARRWDFHAARTPDGANVIEVFRMPQAQSVDMYVSASVPGYLVERYSLPIWVVSDRGLETDVLAQFGLQDMTRTIAEGIAFWLIDLSPSLEKFFAPFADLFRSITVDVTLETNASWDEALLRSSGETLIPVNTEADSAIPTIRLFVTPSLISSLGSASQDPEKRLIREVIRGFRDLIPVKYRGVLPDEKIDQILDRHFIPKEKRMMLVVDPSNRFELWPTECPNSRFVQHADCEIVLDDLGVHLSSTREFSDRELRGPEASGLLNEAVKYLFDQFTGLVEGLNWGECLPYVLARHESLLLRQAHSKFHAPPRIACYGEQEKEEILQEWSDNSVADVAYRFLIEYLVAKLPTGREPMNLLVLDKLLALPHEIIRYGTDSDLAQFEVFDLAVQMLPSGRLGESQDEYDQKRRMFILGMMAGDLAALPKSFATYWTRATRGSDVPAEVRATDPAMLAEFGVTLEDIAGVLSEMSWRSADGKDAICQMGMDECIAWLVEKLDMTSDKAASVIGHFALEPRPEFLTPPPPNKVHDVWPWRFNRRLSYLRRAILKVPSENGSDLIWTPRHLQRSGAYFLTQLLASRLAGVGETESKAFSDFKSRNNNARGRETESGLSSLMAGLERFKVVGPIQSVNGVAIGKVGEIDRIIFDLERKIAYVCECKNLYMAKTPREMSDQLTKILNDDPESDAAIPQALRKADWIRTQLSELLREKSISDDSEGWSVRELVVTNHELFMTKVKEFSIPIVALDSVVSFLTST